MNPGTLIIRVAALFAVIAFVAALRWARGTQPAKKRSPDESLFRLAYHAMSFLLVAASAILMTAILRHDFRYEYVVGYSSRDLPLLYLFAAFWGGQEGTYLLWALFATFMGYALFRRGAWRPAPVMAAYMPTLGALLMLLVHPEGDPFHLVAQVPSDGRGLNPLLQDPWMATHPPIVFFGYAALTVPAVLAWVALLCRDERGWVMPALRWSLVGFVTLGLGIILGGFWAYKVLGWGGYWGWDPVENASLIPWLMVTALIHGLLVQHFKGSMRTPNLLMAVGGYVLVLYATFLTRSGVLADFSVHSFPKGTEYWWLFGATVAPVAFSIWAFRRARDRAEVHATSGFAWPVVLPTIIVLFAISSFLVLLGTSWPIFSSWFGKTSTPTAPFYNQVNYPLYAGLLALLGIAPFLGWMPMPRARWFPRFVPGLLFALVATTLAFFWGGRQVGALVLFFCAMLASASNLVRFATVAQRRPLHTGAALAHVGFGLMFAGIVASGYWGHSARVKLPLGEPVVVHGRTVTYLGHVEGSDPKHRWALQVEERGQTRTAEVTMYRLEEDNIFRKPAILRTLGADFYVAPLDRERPNAEVASSGNAASVQPLVKNEPAHIGGVDLTFRRFEMQSEGEVMVVLAIVEAARGGETESLTLPVRMTPNGLVGEPVASKLAPDWTLTMQGMSVEQSTVQVKIATSATAAAAGTAETAETASDTAAAEPAPAYGESHAGHDHAQEPPVTRDTLVVEASQKPLMNLLWLGTLFMLLGCTLAVIRRAIEAGPAHGLESDRAEVHAQAPAHEPAAAGHYTMESTADGRDAPTPSRAAVPPAARETDGTRSRRNGDGVAPAPANRRGFPVVK